MPGRGTPSSATRATSQGNRPLAAPARVKRIEKHRSQCGSAATESSEAADVDRVIGARNVANGEQGNPVLAERLGDDLFLVSERSARAPAGPTLGDAGNDGPGAVRRNFRAVRFARIVLPLQLAD